MLLVTEEITSIKSNKDDLLQQVKESGNALKEKTKVQEELQESLNEALTKAKTVDEEFVTFKTLQISQMEQITLEKENLQKEKIDLLVS